MDGNDKWEIYRLLVDYADAIDKRDRARVGDCFAEHARARYAGNPVGPGREAILDYLWQHLTSLTSTHFVGNVQIDAVSDRSAQTDSFVIATHVVTVDGDVRLRIRGLRYLDRVERQDDGRWRIVEREHIPVWMTEVPGERLS
jgi:ketosteroid isomerase-like protein